jgi:hypothetical protein
VGFLRSAVSFEGLTRGEIFSRLFFWWFGPAFVVAFLSVWFDQRIFREPLFSWIGPLLTAVVVWRDATRARLGKSLFLAVVAGLIPILGWLYYASVRAPRTAASAADADMAPPNRPGALQRLLDPFANERVALSTRLSARECADRLRRSKISLLAPSSWFSLNAERPVHGRVSADGFAIKRRHPLTRESLITQASGRYEERAGATVIRVRIGVSLFDRVFTFVMFGLVGLLTATTFAAASSTSGQDRWMFGVVPALIFAFVYVVVRAVSLDDDAFLYQFLRHTLEADDVIEGEPL